MAFEELSSGNEALDIALNEGFDVQYTSVIMNCSACQNLGGRCGSNITLLEFLCLCPDQPYPRMCLKPGTHVYSFHINKMLLFNVFLYVILDLKHPKGTVLTQEIQNFDI
ncbi:hypothetical protein SLE2022_345610 [Rubroshorea leprosula]